MLLLLLSMVTTMKQIKERERAIARMNLPILNIRSFLKQNKSDLRSILLTWLIVVAIDYALRASMIFSSLIISEKVSLFRVAQSTQR